MDRLKKALNDNGIEHSEKRFETEKGIQSLGENPFVRHIIIIFHACMKQAFKYNIKMICLRCMHGNSLLIEHACVLSNDWMLHAKMSL